MADWGVEMVNARGCFIQTDEIDEAFVMMGFALNSTGKRINYLCDWPSILLRQGMRGFYQLTCFCCCFFIDFIDQFL